MVRFFAEVSTGTGAPIQLEIGDADVKRRIFAGIGVVLTAALALTGCGSSGSETGSSGDSNSLTVWAWDPAFNIFAMKEAEKIYQKDHPDFTLNIQEVPWDDLQTKLITLASSGQTSDLPDIFLMQNNAFQKNVQNFPELFSDLAGTQIPFAEFPQGVVDYSVIDGTNYGVPFDSGTAIGAYRTDLLEQAGLTVKDFENITWDQFIENGKKVKEATGKPLITSVAGESDLILMMLQSAGSSMFGDNGDVTIANNDVLKEAVDVYSRLVKEGVLVETNSWDEYVGSVVNGNAAGTINGVWILGSIQTAEDQLGKWAVTDIPRLSKSANATNYSANGGSSWAISSNANKELAADFLAKTFAGSTELYDNILHQAGAVANWLPAGASDAYNSKLDFFGGQAVFADVLSYSKQVPSNNTGVYYYEGRIAVSAALTKVIGGANVDDALAEAQKTVEFNMQ